MTYTITEETLNTIIAECMTQGNVIGSINVFKGLDNVEKIDIEQEINNTIEFYRITLK